MSEESAQQCDALIRVVIRANAPLTADRLRELVAEADEFELDVTIPTEGGEVLTVTAGTVDPDSVALFWD